MYKCVGIKRVDFSNANNERIYGNSVFLLKPIDPRNGEGFEFLRKENTKCSLFLSNEDLIKYQIKVGGQYDFSFDESGRPRVDSIITVK